MFDRDEHPRFRDAVELCKRHGVSVGRSDPCFELWLVLHEQEYDKPNDRHRMQALLRELLPEYDPGGAKTPDCDELVTAGRGGGRTRGSAVAEPRGGRHSVRKPLDDRRSADRRDSQGQHGCAVSTDAIGRSCPRSCPENPARFTTPDYTIRGGYGGRIPRAERCRGCPPAGWTRRCAESGPCARRGGRRRCGSGRRRRGVARNRRRVQGRGRECRRQPMARPATCIRGYELRGNPPRSMS